MSSCCMAYVCKVLKQSAYFSRMRQDINGYKNVKCICPRFNVFNSITRLFLGTKYEGRIWFMFWKTVLILYNYCTIVFTLINLATWADKIIFYWNFTSPERIRTACVTRFINMGRIRIICPLSLPSLLIYSTDQNVSLTWASFRYFNHEINIFY